MVNYSSTVVSWINDINALPMKAVPMMNFTRSIGDNGVFSGVLLSWLNSDIWRTHASMVMGKYVVKATSSTYMRIWGVSGHIKIRGQIDCTKCNKSYFVEQEMLDTKIGTDSQIIHCPCDEQAIQFRTDFHHWEMSPAADKGVDQVVGTFRTTVVAGGQAMQGNIGKR